MQEDEQDAQRADIADGEKVEAKQAPAQRATVGKFFPCHAAGHIPSQEETGEETA